MAQLKQMVAEQKITIGRLKDAVVNTSSLESEVERLQSLVFEQQKTIERLQSDAAARETTAVLEPLINPVEPGVFEQPKMSCETPSETISAESTAAEENRPITSFEQSTSHDMSIETYSLELDASVPPTTLARPKKLYVCKCGYDAKNKKNRSTNHQRQFCKLIPRTVKAEYLCPICGGDDKTYDQVKSHLLQFINPKRKNQTRPNSLHADTSVDEHKRALAWFKNKYGPKKNAKK